MIIFVSMRDTGHQCRIFKTIKRNSKSNFIKTKGIPKKRPGTNKFNVCTFRKDIENKNDYRLS